MTACTNHGGKARRVVTAALVGVLSLGAAPMVALASPAATDQVTTLTDSGDNAFSRGIVALGGSDVQRDAEGNFYANAKGNATPLDIYAESVTPLGKGTINIVGNDDYTTTIYVADAEGNATSETVEKIVKPGKYVIAVSTTVAEYAGGVATVGLDVKAASLENLDWFDASSGDTSDKNLTYTGSTLEVGFQSDNVTFTEGEDYTLKVLKAGTDNVESAPSVDVLEAGDYVGYVTGLGQYAGQTKRVDFTVNEFSFAHAQIVVDDVIASESQPQHPTKVYVGTVGAAEYAELDPSMVQLTFQKDASNPSTLFDEVGAYKFLASVDKSNTSIVNNADKTVTVNKIAKMATFTYDGKAIQGSYKVNQAKGEKFDINKLEVFNGETKLTKDTNYTVSVVDVNNPSSNQSYNNLFNNNFGGTYEVTVTVKPGTVNYEAGGSVTFTVVVVKDVIDADANVYVYRNSDGTILTSVEKTYDGEKIFATDFIAKAFNDKNELVTTSDTANGGLLTLSLYDSEGNKVDYAVNAGEYTLKVESTKYELTGVTEIPVTIEKADLSVLTLFGLSDHYGSKYLDQKDSGSYTPAQLDVRYDTGVAVSDNKDDFSDDEGWDRIDQFASDDLTDRLTVERYDDEKGEWVEVPTWQWGQFEGQHRLALTGNADLAKNFVFANADYTTTVSFFVRDAGKLVFNDVAPDQWYVDPVYSAYANKIMNGYATGNLAKLFGPTNEITRAEVACVLFNMAGGQMNESADWYSPVIGWKSFEDVDGTQYYGKAIAWAKKTGVVNGYTDGTFKPEENITREELAAMLANYAKVIDQKDVTPEDAEGTLADFGDGSEVSGWATDVVAWAVESGVMGNGGYLAPADDITRAEVAAMAVNYRFGK